jgi:hypothetical protein
VKLIVYMAKRSISMQIGDPPRPYEITWNEWSFEPRPRRRWRLPGSLSIQTLWDPVPLAIITPHFAKLVTRPPGTRLAFAGEDYGLDAESCANIALANRRGFRLEPKQENAS